MDHVDQKKHGIKHKVGFTQEPVNSRRGSLRSRTSQGGFTKEIDVLLAERRMKRLMDNGYNVVPRLLENMNMCDKFQNITDKANVMLGIEQDKMTTTTPGLKPDDLSAKHSFSTMNVTMDDIATQISLSIQSSTDIPILQRTTEFDEDIPEVHKMPSYIKVILSKTEDIVLFEKGSVTVGKETEEAAAVLEDNKEYDYLTVGKGRNRRRMDAETQTVEILYKSRHANTDRINKLEIGTFVSNYDMFDTYADLEAVVTKVETENSNMQVTTYKHKGVDQFQDLKVNPSFQLAIMLTQRLLAGNIYREEQKRFRNMYLPDPLSEDVKYLYRLKDLWVYKTIDAIGKAVSCFDWCPANGDLLVASYGVFNFLPHEDRRFGIVCIWSIKNPVNPERKYRYPYPVTAVAFSKKNPQLIAVGLYTGQVQILDITEENINTALVAVSERSTSAGTEPITEIKWIDVHCTNGDDREQLLTASEDGTIMKYSITSGLFLVGFQQMKLDRVEGHVEGIHVARKESFIEADRHPQALMVKVHPEKSDMYFVGTDEGCIHKCSTNYPHQHTEIFQMHNGSIFTMEYSPWSPKIFLTCGSDWCIRVWVENVFEPLIYLSSGIGPVNGACWSPIHSTIIIGTTRNAVEIWDIRRNILKPVSVRTFGAGTVYLTKASFSNCGRSVIVGDEEGAIHVCALEDMPFPPHFQFKELESAIFKAIVSNPELIQRVENLGILSYPDGAKRRY